MPQPSDVYVREWPEFGKGRERRYFTSLESVLSPEMLVAWDCDTGGEVTEIESVDITPYYGGLLEGPACICLINGGFWRYLSVTQSWVCVRESKHVVSDLFEGACCAADIVRGLWRAFDPVTYSARINGKHAFESQ